MLSIKSTAPLGVLVLLFLLLTGCGDDLDAPKAEEIYVFPYTSQVDAKYLGCGYEGYEEVSDWIKIWMRDNMPKLTNSDLTELGQYFHNNLINATYTTHSKESWAIEIVDRIRPFLVKNYFTYDIHIVDDTTFNAFTIPGGNIYITTGLLNMVNNKDELAFILGHELGHNENNHTKELARLYEYTRRNKKLGGWSSIGAVLTKVAAAICGKPDELECDISSIYLLYKAGYDPEKALGGIELLRKLSPPKPKNSLEDKILTFFMTHPWAKERYDCVASYVYNSKVTTECEKIYEDQKGIVTTKQSPLNMWEYPIKQKSIFKIPKGKEVQVICDCAQQKYRKNRDWLYISYEESDEQYVGWVDKKYIAFHE